MRHSPCGRRNRLGLVRGTSSGRLGNPTAMDLYAARRHTYRLWRPPRRGSEIRLGSAAGFGSTHRRFGLSSAVRIRKPRTPRASRRVLEEWPPSASGHLGRDWRTGPVARSGHPSAEADDCASCRLASNEFDIPVLSRADRRRNRKLTPLTPSGIPLPNAAVCPPAPRLSSLQI
jgi:hypothetical protein